MMPEKKQYHVSVYLQPELSLWVDRRLQGGNFATISDYFRTLIREDMAAREAAARKDRP